MDKDTDENLREQLKAYGQDVGPINNSTRPYWQKALAKLTLQLGDSPIQCNSYQKETPLKKQRNGLFRSRSADIPQYTSDESFSESDDDSILTDGPGSTPFPAKVPRSKKSSSSKKITSFSIETSDSPGNIKKVINQKNVHLSMTPKSIGNRQVKDRDKKFNPIPQKDRELHENLKAYGECVGHSPMNKATRSQWKKRLDKLRGVSPAATNSDSELVYYSPSSESSRRVASQIGYFNKRVSDGDGKEYEDVDVDWYENKDECCIQNIQMYRRHFCEHLMSIFSFLLRGIVCIVVIIAGILLVGFPEEDDKTLETNL